ncbi:hypothetical protein [Lacinutrix algicola]|uniref:hypothetical protein n=1 Tax=Lacinutrix algicola TaxID=342954 RepID=UPI0006E33A65|nr:hypothetical protein [Lacinutrix algicola]
MIKKSILLITLCICAFGFSQQDDTSKPEDEKLEQALSLMYKSDIDMEIDEKVYSIVQGNSYLTEDQKSAIIGMVVPSSYADMKKDLENQKAKAGMTILDKGEVTHEDGKKILFTKSSLEREGEVYIMFIYCKENDEESSIMITSYFEKNKENKYLDLIQKAAFSAKLK